MSGGVIAAIVVFALVFWLVFTAICVYIMGSKGQPTWKGILFGAFLGPFGIIVVIFYPTTDEEIHKQMYERKMIDINEYNKILSSNDKKS